MRLHGPVVNVNGLGALATVAERGAMAEELIDALAELHAVDRRAAGLEDLRTAHRLSRTQLRRFDGLWAHNRTRDIPAVERLARQLRDHLPASPATTIVHGDFQLGNTMIHRARRRG